MSFTRRDVVLQGLFGAGMWGLRSLATGLPISFLMNPRKALAGGNPVVPGPGNTAAQYVIFNTSNSGDPINANVPGTYIQGTSSVAAPVHAPAFSSTPWTATALNSAGLDVMGRTVFFHHATYTVVHPDEAKVLHLMNTSPTADMFPSMLAAQLAPQLGTIQAEPVALGSETITFNSRPQPTLNPVALAAILGAENGPLGSLQGLRDKYLDQMNAVVRSEGNPAQQAFIDRYVLSQRQAREVSHTLLQSLSSITGNDQNSQLLAAVTLIRMNVAPVMTVHIDFGGDNHTDTNLAGEVSQTTAGIASIATMMANLKSATLADGVTSYADRVTFMSLNVFGRTLAINNGVSTANGRTHQGNHHCTVIIGKPFKGGVIGGIEADTPSKDYKAVNINSTTGAAVGGADAGGDIQFEDTFNSMAKTVAIGVGVPASVLNSSADPPILSGQPVAAALVGS